MTLLFIFDMDNVLYDYDWRKRMEGMTAMTGHSLEELRERWWHDKGEWAAENGAYSADEYLAELGNALGQEIDEAEWVRVRRSAMTPWPDSFAAVRRASQLGTVTLLTNHGALAYKHLRTLAPELIELFGDHMFTSSYYGSRKPNTLVFERVLEAYATPASDAFFADDFLVNIEGAQEVGITCYHFGDSAGMLAAIEEFAAAHR